MIDSAETQGGNSLEALGFGPGLGASGLNVAGVLSPGDYDALVPETWRTRVVLPSAQSIFVIGSGGVAFYEAARNACPGAEHPLDEFCETVMERVASDLDARGVASRVLYYWQRLGSGDEGRGEFADFVGLARAAGLGASSRLGLLIHPRFGPWFAIRALLLTELSVEQPDRPLTTFDPCRDCDAPCAAACHGNAIHPNAFAADRCAETRHHDPRCATRCDARLACPVGRQFRYDAAALAHHMTAHFRSVS